MAGDAHERDERHKATNTSATGPNGAGTSPWKKEGMTVKGNA